MTDEHMRFVRSKDGTEIGWVQTGSGPPLVLVHGTTADHTRWATVLEQLTARFTVHAIDRRGRGMSGDAEPYAIEREFEDVEAVVDSLREPVFLLGHSYGAVCSLEAAIGARNVAKLVLYEPPIPGETTIVPGDTLQRVDELLAQGDRDAATTTFFREVVRAPEEMIQRVRSLPSWQARIAAAHTMTREARVESTYRFDPQRYKQLSTPTLLLLGGDSPSIFADPIRMLEKTLPDARVVVMPGQQHVAMDTAPGLFVGAVLDFLQP